MGIYVSDKNAVVFQFESGTYGTASGNAKWIGLVQDHSPTDNENVQQIRYTGTNSRNVGMFVNTAKDYEGTITFLPQDFRMLGFALGSVVDTSGTTSTHTMSELDSDGRYAYVSGTNHNFPSFTIVDSKKSPNGDGYHQVRTYKGCVVNTFNINASQGEPISCELSYIAQSLTNGSKTSDIPTIDDEDTTRPYLWSDVQVHLPSGTVINEVTEVIPNFNNNLNPRHYDNGSKVIDNITPENRDYEISITMDANSTWGKTFYETYWQGGSAFNMLIDYRQSTTELGIGIFSGCKITSFESPSPNEGINEYSLTIMPQNCIFTGSDAVLHYNPW